MCICPISCLNNLKVVYSDYSLEMSPRTVLERLHKYGLFGAEDDDGFLSRKAEEAQ